MRLYHNPISTCSQKVRMVLHEKGLAFEDTVLDLQQGEQFEPGYQALNPNAVVPTLEDQGSVMIESTLINEYLDDAYPTKPLKPVSAVERHQMRLFCKCILTMPCTPPVVLSPTPLACDRDCCNDPMQTSMPC